MLSFFLSPKDDLQAVLNGLKEPAEIHLCKGIYNQKLEILSDGVTLIGESAAETVISFNDFAKKLDEKGLEYTTFKSQTLRICANGVTLKNLTVENSVKDPVKYGQCVALSVHGDNFYAENVILKSTQDTLFLSPFPDDLVVRYQNFLPRYCLYKEGENLQVFKNCKIYGTVDFIFGCGKALFYGCDLISVNDGREYGFVCAPAHSLAQKTGFVFYGCRFSAEGAKEGTVYLARPWRDFGKCTFINCRLDNCINPLLFDKWNDTARDKTARFEYFNLDCAFKLHPVSWCKSLTPDGAENIIKYIKTKCGTN